MKHERNLINQIKALQIENECLQKGITMREEINDEIRKDKDIQIHIIKHLTYLILYMEALEFVAKDNHNHTSKIIVSAINHFKEELTSNFYDDGNDLPNTFKNGIYQ